MEQMCYNSLLLLCQAIPSHEPSIDQPSPQLDVIVDDIKAVKCGTTLEQSSIAMDKLDIARSPIEISCVSEIVNADESREKDGKKTMPGMKRKTAADSKSLRSRNNAVESPKYDKTASLNAGGSRNIGLGAIPATIFSAFNTGDMESLSKIIESITTETVVLVTKALPDPTVGREHVYSFFEALIDGHPDAYLLASDVNFLDESTLNAKLHFKGTKALHSEKEFYFMKSSLVDSMNLTKYSEADIVKLRQLEESLIAHNKPIEVEFNGSMTLIFHKVLKIQRHEDGTRHSESGYKVSAFVFDYELKYFREAVIIPGFDML